MKYKDFIKKTFLHKNISVKTKYLGNIKESGKIIKGEVIKIHFYEDAYEGDCISLDIKINKQEVKQIDLTLSTEIEFLDETEKY